MLSFILYMYFYTFSINETWTFPPLPFSSDYKCDVISVANSSITDIKNPPMIPPPRGNNSPKVTTNNNLASILLDVFQQAFFQNQIISLKNNPYDSIYLKCPERKISGCRDWERGVAANGCKDPVWGEGRCWVGFCKFTKKFIKLNHTLNTREFYNFMIL